ncbi:hypothetical protein DdX_18792 [Ditylenchus destructor]|uniref:Uncharacterized protein n=1 Tax=Ditylenchus destructor TaxID=166010 RepID=A0AAD4MK25_9BILA|nr:hypothetical protein DdX_18792 [Ditylenchus destructor]
MIEYPSRREWNDRSTVFYARAELNDDNWPLFQHFVRLITDPFIYIDSMELTGGHSTPIVPVPIQIFDKELSPEAYNEWKFLELENWDDYQGVHSIQSYQAVMNQNLQPLKKDYAKFLVKEEHNDDDHSTEYSFEFVNNAIGKKLQLIFKIFDDGYWSYRYPVSSMEIMNL